MTDHVRITVLGNFAAWHRCAESDLHQHYWQITAGFMIPAHADATRYRALLDRVLAIFDDTVLPAEIEWSEDLARFLQQALGAIWVEAARPEERIAAEWP